MAVVTISRGSFSGGTMLAERVSVALGYRCIARDAVVEKAAAYGVSQDEIRAVLDRPLSFWDRPRHSKYVYLTLVQAALTEEVRQGRAVYHGNAGHLLLAGVSHVLRTRIIAPLEFRVAQVSERLGMNRDAAIAYIQKVDRDRRQWVQYLYGVDSGDPGLYDLVLNLESFSLTQACDVIVGVLRERCFLETPESRAAMEDLALASRVRAHLAVTEPTSHLEVEIVARGGAVSIRGAVLSREQLEKVRAVVLAVPGVTRADPDVVSDIAV